MSKGGSDWKKLPPLPVEVVEGALLNYKVVRQMFGWRQNVSIKNAVYAGKLKRVRISNQRSGFRITAESALALRTEIIELSEAAEEFGYSPGQIKAMNEARNRKPVPEVTLELNEQEIVRQADNLSERTAISPTPTVSVPAPQTENEKLGAYMNARGAAKVTAYRALDWRTKNKLIEAGLV